MSAKTKKRKRVLNHRQVFKVKYPPRGAWEWKLRMHFDSIDYLHEGYWSEKLKPCPVCGRIPVFEEYVYESTPADQPAKIFVGFCQTCELRTRKPGRLKEAVLQWQSRRFSPDSLLVCHRPRPDTYGSRMLCNKVVASAIDDALFYARMRNETEEGSEAWTSYGGELKKLEDFFRTSLFMFELDPDGVISDIRKVMYPTLNPEDRIKIPLHLAQIYKGKRLLKECTQKSSLSKQP